MENLIDFVIDRIKVNKLNRRTATEALYYIEALLESGKSKKEKTRLKVLRDRISRRLEYRD